MSGSKLTDHKAMDDEIRVDGPQSRRPAVDQLTG
jgi:hypothetical protein